jgi:aminopeptidase N
LAIEQVKLAPVYVRRRAKRLFAFYLLTVFRRFGQNRVCSKILGIQLMTKTFRLSALLLFAIFSISVGAQTGREPQQQHTFDAQHYVIRTNFDRAAKTVFGDTTVVVKPLQNNFRTLSLDAANLQIQSITFENSAKPLSFRLSAGKINIALDKDFAPSDTISVRIKYKTVKPKAGIYFVDAQRAEKGALARSAQIWTQGEPEDNRYWFPSYDSPDDKATTEQFITVGADETAIANGELLETRMNRDGTKTFHYRMNAPHPTYLTSLVVGKYARVVDEYNGVPLAFYVYPGSEQIVQPAYGKTKKMFAAFENLIGIKFPFNKYDQTVVADFRFGGMENITATTMADTEIYSALRDGGDRVAVENLVSHELAHSWFGNLVTCKNWSNLWLNEGFATFMESVFLENEYGRDAYLAEMRQNAESYFIEETFVKHPLVNPRAKPDILLFDSTTYKKGGFVVHMLRETVGDEIFWKAINAYLNAHRFESVETADLQRAFEIASGKNLDWFFDQWTRKAGFPRLEIEPAYDDAARQLTLRIRQTQKADSQTPAVFRIYADVEIQTAKNAKTERIEMNAREQIFKFSVSEKPTGIIFDKNDQVLKKLEIAPIK